MGQEQVNIAEVVLRMFTLNRSFKVYKVAQDA